MIRVIRNITWGLAAVILTLTTLLTVMKVATYAVAFRTFSLLFDRSMYMSELYEIFGQYGYDARWFMAYGPVAVFLLLLCIVCPNE